MQQSSSGHVGWAPTVYYVQSNIHCTLQHAWQCMLDYEAWNPSFADAEVVSVRGQPRVEGQLILIKKKILAPDGQPMLPFYAETVKVVPLQHIVWYLYPQDGDSLRNFVDFGLLEMPGYVQFAIHYYAQNRLSGAELSRERESMIVALEGLTTALKNYAEATK